MNTRELRKELKKLIKNNNFKFEGENTEYYLDNGHYYGAYAINYLKIFGVYFPYAIVYDGYFRIDAEFAGLSDENIAAFYYGETFWPEDLEYNEWVYDIIKKYHKNLSNEEIDEMYYDTDNGLSDECIDEITKESINGVIYCLSDLFEGYTDRLGNEVNHINYLVDRIINNIDNDYLAEMISKNTANKKIAKIA